MIATLEQVAALVANGLGINEPPAADARLAEDLGADSLDKVVLEMLCEDTFHFRFHDDQSGFGNCNTVGDLHAAIIAEQAKMQESVAP